jgi:lipoprotein signal peptidase
MPALLDALRTRRYRILSGLPYLPSRCLKHEGFMNLPTERPYYWLFALLALVGLAADQASKYVVFAKLYPGDREGLTQLDVIPNYFALRTAYTGAQFPDNEWQSPLRTLSGPRVPHVNRGALFGIGNEGESGMNSVFAVVSVLAAGFILLWAARSSVAQDRFLSIALGLILGGTLGNLYDRVIFNGVRDFLYCYYVYHVDGVAKERPWPDFNIADCCLVCGAGVLLVHSFFVTEKAPDKVEAAAPLQATTPVNGV